AALQPHRWLDAEDDRGVEPAGVQPLEEEPAHPLDDVWNDQRRLLAQRLEQRAYQDRAHRRGDAESDVSVRLAAESHHLLARLLELPQDAGRVIREQAPMLSGSHALASTVQQPHAQLFLEVAHVRAD